MSLLVMLVAAVSIGSMLALHYRTENSVLTESSPVPATVGMPATEQPLPMYEEPIDPSLLKQPSRTTRIAPQRVPLGVVAKDQFPAGRTRPAWQRNAVNIASLDEDRRPSISVVIDDLGFDRARGDRVVDLPGPLTMAFLPYAQDLVRQVEAARHAGHELLVHVPMDPKNRDVTDPGPNALLVDLGKSELLRRLEWNLSQFEGYVGINNHMGSRFTADADVVSDVMVELKRRGLLFLDSRTSGDSVAFEAAHRHGVPALSRDVFIDHIRTRDAVHAALAEVERVARRNGHAVAIGHPRDITIDALADWLPLLESRGFRLVPVSTLVREVYSGG